MKVLITGIKGFAGSHLTEHLQGIPGVEVAGLDLTPFSEDVSRRLGDAAPPVHCCDLGDAAAVSEVLGRERPDAVIHLAARAQVSGAWKNGVAIMETNAVCTQTLMQAIHEKSPEARVLLVSSSEVYGKASPAEMPFTEDSPLRPNNPYSTSKVAQEFIGLQYHAAFGAPVLIARPFNHIGPGQTGDFVVASFSRQLAEIEAGIKEPVLRVGNLESERDFTDVRDIVRAYYMILTEGQPGERYNIASGNSRRISDILSILLKYSRVRPEIEPIPELMRPSDTPVVTGDSSRLRKLSGWEPVIPVEQSLDDALDYWRERIRGGY
ncbi:MAG: GDP-mannose 4,6-dehydratase [Thermoleophilia bacterium]|nr:GDP-mannose 4,6-dehydratase [Thermoleophilia bacterium]